MTVFTLIWSQNSAPNTVAALEYSRPQNTALSFNNIELGRV